MPRYIVPAFFEVEADSIGEAEVHAAAAQEFANEHTGVDLLLDEHMPIMQLPNEMMTIHSVLSLLRIRPMRGIDYEGK